MKINFGKAGALALAAALQLAASGAFAADTWDGGGTDGLWNTATNWLDDSTPTSTDDVLLDNSALAGSYTVTLPNVSGLTCKSLTVGYAGNVNDIRISVPSSNAQTLALDIVAAAAANTETFVLEQNGRYDCASIAAAGNSVLNNLKANNKSHIKSGGYIFHDSNSTFGATFPLPTASGGATFDSGSTVEIGTNFNTAPPAAATFSMAGYTYGNLIMSSSVAKTINLTVSIGNSSVLNTLTVGANITLNVTAPAASTRKWILNGNIVNNGLTTFTGGATATDRNVHITGTPTVVSGTGTLRIGATAAANTSVDPGATLEIASGQTFQETGADVVGTGLVKFDAGSNVIILDALGINGFIQTSGANDFGTGANYSFTSTTASQVTGAAFPATVNNLTVNNTFGGGTVTNSQALAVNGVLALTAGRVITTATNTLTVNNGGLSAVTRTAGSVSGDGLIRTIDASITGARTIHTSSAATGTYAPVTIDVTGGTGTGTFKVFTVDGDHPSILTAATSLNRYWTVTPAGFTGLTANLTFDYQTADAAGQGTEASYVFGRWNGASWTTITPTTQSANTATLNGVTTFSDWTMGEAAGVPVTVSGVKID